MRKREKCAILCHSRAIFIVIVKCNRAVHLRRYSAGGASDDTRPMRFPSMSLKWAKMTIPGMTVTGMAISPPSSAALSSEAWMSSTST